MVPFLRLAFAGLLVVFSPALALAHHPSGGMAPQNGVEGFLSGLAHPVIGLDHLAFVLGVGLLSAFGAGRAATPLLFVGATILGALLHLGGVALPAAELVVAASVAAVGVLALSGRAVGFPVVGALFTLAGLFHGYAYGEAVVGSESGPVLAYLAGFGLVQYALALLAGHLAAGGLGRARALGEAVGLRISGGVVAGVGAAILSERLLGAAGLAG